MCGRYQTVGEAGVEIRPGDLALVLTVGGEKSMRWGLHLPNQKKLIINARSETAADKPFFRHAMQQGRCIIAASAFYEWDEKKRCHAFASPQGDTLYMAALYQKTDDGENRFVILTQPAAGGAQTVHPRMPCLLPSEEYRFLWLHDAALAKELLQGAPPLSIRRIQTDAEQTDFFTS